MEMQWGREDNLGPGSEGSRRQQQARPLGAEVGVPQQLVGMLPCPVWPWSFGVPGGARFQLGEQRAC